MRYLLLFLLCVQVFEISAQTDLVHCTDSTYCIPAVVGLSNSRGIEVKQERVFNYTINTQAVDTSFNSNNALVDRNRRWSFRAKFPILLRDNIKIAGGLSYDIEEFRFRMTNNFDDPFYNAIDDKNLKSLGFALYVLKPFLGNKFLIVRTSANANGDYANLNQKWTRFMKFSGTAMFGIKLSAHKNIAIGASSNYTFGRHRIYPVLAYNQTFNHRWGIESLLPVYLKVRFRPNDNNIILAKSELAGANYNVNLDINGDGTSETYYLEKSEARFLLAYERSLFAGIWLGVEAGLRYNLDFNMSDDFVAPDASVLLNNSLNEAFMSNISLFFSPSASMMQSKK